MNTKEKDERRNRIIVTRTTFTGLRELSRLEKPFRSDFRLSWESALRL